MWSMQSVWHLNRIVSRSDKSGRGERPRRCNMNAQFSGYRNGDRNRSAWTVGVGNGIAVALRIELETSLGVVEYGGI